LTETLDLVAHRDGKASASEAYRDLRTAILLSNPGQPPRTILVTSAIPEDGKTATAINLAVVFAQLHARVLLVDTDLRRPRLHKAFGVSNRQGASNALSGMVTDLSQLISATGIENLDLLPSGPIPPDPSELLNSPTFVQMCREFLELGYDHVVFDSPPVLAVADSVVIASVVDACILVARAGRTDRQSIRMAVDKLQRTRKATLGLVLNDLAPDADGAAQYGYRYYGEDEGAPRDSRNRGETGGATGV
jgi:capsular exopolysaccharide synthesis family protein